MCPARCRVAGRIFRERAGLNIVWQRIVGVGITLLVAAFVAMVLADPISYSRKILSGAVAWLGVTGAILAAVVLAIATYVVRSARVSRRAQPGETGDGSK